MDFKTFQLQVQRTVKKDFHSRQLANFVIGLNEESGEVASHIKKHVFHGHALDKEAVEDELGDVLWYAFNLATELGIDMNNVARKNDLKLLKRYPDGFTEDASINREL